MLWLESMEKRLVYFRVTRKQEYRQEQARFPFRGTPPMT
jgi:hypothetical protein